MKLQKQHVRCPGIHIQTTAALVPAGGHYYGLHILPIGTLFLLPVHDRTNKSVAGSEDRLDHRSGHLFVLRLTTHHWRLEGTLLRRLLSIASS